MQTETLQKTGNRKRTKNQYRLKAWVLFQVKKNQELKKLSMEHFDISEATFYRWCSHSSPSLTETGYLHKLAGWLKNIGIEDDTLIEQYQ